jgi:UDP-N-acetylglucosamine--N-acetylmuramyl-(pentapeptide) pyrophosphoryl-undecaprenol N-acetylglucosamine transferase
MSFMIAAAGTGGHVFPGLAVGEALIENGVANDQILFVGGDRLEATVYPSQGFRFVGMELAGLQRAFTLRNLRIPAVVTRARNGIGREIELSDVAVVLGMGGYVTIPAGLAARRHRVPFFNAEQNAEAGLANKISSRWARKTFVSFPETGGLRHGMWVGNPVRRPFWNFDRAELRTTALERFDLDSEVTVVGVFGGSLGSQAINDAVADMVRAWEAAPIQVLHLTGEDHLSAMRTRRAGAQATWIRLGFETRMDLFYAASDVVIARAGGAVAELTATATPAILVPGSFGSGGHQEGNARALERAGAARIVPETHLDRLGQSVAEIVSDEGLRTRMSRGATEISKPEAALTIAQQMIEAAR